MIRCKSLPVNSRVSLLTSYCRLEYFRHKTQERVRGFCDKNNRGSRHLGSPAESQIDCQKTLRSRIFNLLIADEKHFLTECSDLRAAALHMDHLKDKPLSPSIIPPLQLCAWRPMFSGIFSFLSFHLFLFGVCDSFRANTPTAENTA